MTPDPTYVPTWQEYLTSDVCTVEEYRVSPAVAHSQLALASVTYLLRNDLDLTMTDHIQPNDPLYLRSYKKPDYRRFQCPMLLYIINSGFKHISHILREDDPIFSFLMDLQCQIHDMPLKYETIIRGITQEWGGNPDSMFVEVRDFVFDILIHFGPKWMVEGYLHEKPHLHKAESGLHALTLAITAKKFSCAKVLLDLGVDVNKPIYTNDRGILTPLTFSILESLPDFVHLFLERGSLFPSNIFHVAVRHPTEVMPTIIRTLLRHGADAKSLSNTGNNALHTLLDANRWSSSEDACLEIVQILVDAGCEFDAPNVEGIFPLQLAARLQFVSLMQYFVDKGTHFQSSAIHDVIRASDKIPYPDGIKPRAIDLMLLHGADANSLSSTGNNLLHTLLEQRLGKWQECEELEGPCLQITRSLVDAGCDFDAPNIDQITPLYLAIKLRFLSVIQYLLDKGAHFHTDVIHAVLRCPTNTLHDFSKDFHKVPAVVRAMLVHGANPNSLSSIGNNPLHTLLDRGPHDWTRWCRGEVEEPFLQITQILVDEGCEFDATNAHDLTPLYLAVRNQFPSVIIEYLLSIGAHIHHDAIHTYLQSSTEVSPAVIRMMLLHGADPNSLSSAGNSPLHTLLDNRLHYCGVEGYCLQVIQILVDEGCKFDATNAHDLTPLYLAVRNHSPTVIEYLLSMGARIQDDAIHTYLQSSTEVNPSVIRMMLQHGADAKSLSRTGNNALHELLDVQQWRISEPDACLETIQILVDAGCAFDAPDMEGITPLHFAAGWQSSSIIQYFVDKGSRFQHNAIHAVIRRSFLDRIDPAVIQVMLLHGADANSLSSTGNNPLHILLQQERSDSEQWEEGPCLQVTRTLVDAGCDFDAPNIDMITPLYLAIKRRFLSVIQYLLDKGAHFHTDVIHTALKYPTNAFSHHFEGFHDVSPAVVRAMLLHGADPNLLSSTGNNPLHTLLDYKPDREWRYGEVENSYLQVTQILVDAGCEFDAMNADDLTPLHLAARRQLPSIIQYLIQKGARFRSNAIHGIHDSPRHRDHTKVNMTVIHMMLLHGADVNSLSSTGNNLLHTLLNNWKFEDPLSKLELEGKDTVLELVEMLVDEGCEFDTPNTEGITPLHLAARRCLLSVIKYLLDKGARFQADSIHTALQNSCGANPTVIRTLLLHGADARSLSSTGNNPLHTLLDNAEGEDAFMYAFIDNSRDEDAYLEVVQMLVDEGCEFDAPNAEGITPLHMAARWRFPSVIRYLLKKGARFHEDAVQPILTTLDHLTFKIDSTVIPTILLHGASVNSLSSTGNNPLHMLLEPRQGEWRQWEEGPCLQVTHTLVDAGCDFNAQNNDQITPLYLAIKRRFLSVIQYLLDKGARFHTDDIHTALRYPTNAPDDEAFHKAIPAVVRTMLLHGADPNSLSSTGNNPLHTLLDHGPDDEWRRCDVEDSRLQVTRILVDAGCEFDATNADDLTPLDLAARHQFPSIIQYLTRKGARFRSNAIHDSLQHRDHTKVNMTVIRMMLLHGADANSLSSTGNHLLHTLLNNPGLEDTVLEVVEMLVDKGCEFDTPNTEEITPLHLAARQCLLSVIQYLLDKGARFRADSIHTALQNSQNPRSV
jgi:ankyrin repeat protein